MLERISATPALAGLTTREDDDPSIAVEAEGLGLATTAIGLLRLIQCGEIVGHDAVEPFGAGPPNHGREHRDGLLETAVQVALGE